MQDQIQQSLYAILHYNLEHFALAGEFYLRIPCNACNDIALQLGEFWAASCNELKRATQGGTIMSSLQSVRLDEFSDWRSPTVQGKAKEEWMRLCEQAAVEKDSQKLMKLVAEISRMLDEKEQRLKHTSSDSESSSV